MKQTMNWLKKCFGYGEQPSPPPERGDRASPMSPLLQQRSSNMSAPAVGDASSSSSAAKVVATDAASPQNRRYENSRETFVLNQEFIDAQVMRRVSDDWGSSGNEESKSRAPTPPIRIPSSSRRSLAKSPLGVESSVSPLGYIHIRNQKLCFFNTSKHYDYFKIYQVNRNRSQTFIESGSEKNYELKLTKDHVDCYFKLSFYDKNREYLGDILSETITYMSLMSREKVACTPISSANDINDGSLFNAVLFEFDGDGLDLISPRGPLLEPARNVGIFRSNQNSLLHHDENDDSGPSISGSSSLLSNDAAAGYGQYSSL